MPLRFLYQSFVETWALRTIDEEVSVKIGWFAVFGKDKAPFGKAKLLRKGQISFGEGEAPDEPQASS